MPVPGTNVFQLHHHDGFGGTNSALGHGVCYQPARPVAVNDTASTPENVAVIVPVLVNDSDPDGDALTIISASSTNGTAIISGTNIVFTPATNFVGTATADYTITDAFGGTNSAVITISVTNRPPLANPDSYGITEKHDQYVCGAGNDLVQTPGGSLSLVSVSTTNAWQRSAARNVVFTPAVNIWVS